MFVFTVPSLYLCGIFRRMQAKRGLVLWFYSLSPVTRGNTLNASPPVSMNLWRLEWKILVGIVEEEISDREARQESGARNKVATRALLLETEENHLRASSNVQTCTPPLDNSITISGCGPCISPFFLEHFFFLHLLGRNSTTWATPSALYCFSFFQVVWSFSLG
jgi:hypothetical protein